MKTLQRSWLLITLFLLSSYSNYLQEISSITCVPDPVTGSFKNATEIIQVLDSMVYMGIPGVSIGIQSSDGYWEHSSGFAKLEDQIPMEPCHLIYLQSIAKLYLATATLKLKEQGKLELDAPIGTYLPTRITRYIDKSEKITVRMLLNHTSGIPEYNDAPAYIAYLLQHPDHVFSPEDYLKYIDGRSLSFDPGSKYSYRNTNYLILALLVDVITGDHAAYMRQEIFEPLNLRNTLYRAKPDYLNDGRLINSYWDRHSDGIIENVSQMQRTNVASLIGDDGIVATPEDAIKFLNALMNEQIINKGSLAEMMDWQLNSDGTPAYGLGLDYTLFPGENIGFGHSGGGLGGGSELYYFPEKDLYYCIGINLGIITEGPLNDQILPLVEKLHKTILK